MYLVFKTIPILKKNSIFNDEVVVNTRSFNAKVGSLIDFLGSSYYYHPKVNLSYTEGGFKNCLFYFLPFNNTRNRIHFTFFKENCMVLFL